MAFFKRDCPSHTRKIQKAWEEERAQIEKRANDWYDTVAWYADQGGRSSDPEVVGIVKQIPPPRITPPSPLDRLSEEEQKRYPGAMFLEYREFVDDDPTTNPNGYKVHIRILKRKGKIDPYMRVEEWIDGTGALIKRDEMAADHLLVRLKEGMTEEALLEELKTRGCLDASLKRVTDAVPLYELSLTPCEKEKWEGAWEKAVSAIKDMELTWEPDFFFTVAM